MVDVDAMLPALQQVRERGPEIDVTRGLSAQIADSDESWWLHRARVLGLTGIVPVEPWPRQPEYFTRPRGYLHTYGTPNLSLQSDLDRWADEMKRREDEGASG
jgi:hypothetical protein